MGELCCHTKYETLDEESERLMFDIWLDRKKARCAPRLRIETNPLRKRRFLLNLDKESTAASDEEFSPMPIINK